MGEYIQKNKNLNKGRTIPIPFDLGEIKENISITTSKLSTEKIINYSIKCHLEGNIAEAIKYYRYCLDQGCNDHRVFSNYGLILRGLGKLKEAEFTTRKAIEINPDFADAYSNLGTILNDLGKLKEADFSLR